MPSKNPVPRKSMPGQSPNKIMDVKGPMNFPSIGATMSPHAEAYLKAHGASSAGSKSRPSWRHRIRWRKVIKRSALVLIVLILLVGGWLGYKFSSNLTKAFGGNIFDLFHTTKLSGENVGRVNILLAGDSADDPGHEGADLTDSIMIISLNTRNNTAFMMSVPRDLWVNIPGFGYSKINAAYEDGQSENFSQAGYPNGGMGLLEEVVSQNFNITINYYALVDYTAFRDSVNAVGGITINIQSPDGLLYDPSTDYATGGILVNLKNGQYTLDGEQALDLARARGDAYGSIGFEQSDFTRTTNQRLMLVALKNKALSVGVLSNPLKLANLFDSLGNNVKTDFTVSDIRRLYDLGKKVNSSKIQSISLNNVNGQDLLQSYQTYDGEDALIPAAGLNDYSAIQTYLQQLTATTSPN